MNDLYDILNINKIDLEETIKASINEVVMKELNNLTKERTCLIYTSYLYASLKRKNVLCYIMDTFEDLNSTYQHRFIMVPKDKNHRFIIDLNINIFGHQQEFTFLENNGYQLLNNAEYLEYLSHINVKNGIKIKKR